MTDQSRIHKNGIPTQKQPGSLSSASGHGHLNSPFRGSGLGGGGGGLGGGRTLGHGIGHPGHSRISRKDKIIQSTDIDALSSKYSAYLKGYIHDPYLQAIVDGQKQQSTSRDNVSSSFVPKFPVINIGMSIMNYYYYKKKENT